MVEISAIAVPIAEGDAGSVGPRPARLAASLVATVALTLAPLGAGAGADEPLALVELADGIFVHTAPHGEASPQNLGGVANVAAIVGDAAVAVLDTGGSARFGRRLRAAVERLTPLPVRYVINTHVHPDHVLGNAAFEGEGVTFVGHHKLPRAMAMRGPHYLRSFERLVGDGFAGSRIVAPTLLVESRLSLDLGGRLLVLGAHATAHTDNDLTVLDARTGTLFAGDLLFRERLPVVDGSLKGWLAVLDALRETPAARVVPGHGAPSVMWPAVLAPQGRYLRGLLEGVRAVIAEGGTIAQAIARVGREERDRWLLFDDNHPRNVTASFAELEWE